MIQPMVDSTLDSVSKALDDAGKLAPEIDAIVLVGGSTRTPLVARLLLERTGIEPLQDVHPDLCVALGAGVLASRLEGRDVERVLVDVSPYSFGPSYLGVMEDVPYSLCYKPIIRRNTPLPVTRTESYCTASAHQTVVDIEIFQGDNPDALQNILVGRFRIDGLRSVEGPNEVLCRMSLDLDGILHVAAIEKETGRSKQVTIQNAFAIKTPKEIAAARKRLAKLYSTREEDWEQEAIGEEEEVEELERILDIPDPAPRELAGRAEAEKLLERSRALLPAMHPDDVEEAVSLHERMASALVSGDAALLEQASKELRELLFFLEGK
jgi:molecular chaperone DnaK (HSP70)